MTKAEHTDSNGNWTPAREKLHATIMSKFLDKVQPVPPTKKPVAFFTMGGPAAGKGTLVKHLKATTNIDFDNEFVLVNPDDVKDEIPEYKKAKLIDMQGHHPVSARDGAWLVHDESSDIAANIHEIAASQRKNILVDGTGKNPDKYIRKIKELKDKGYEVHLVMPHIDMETAFKRVESRAEDTGRFVPEDVVRQAHSLIPDNFEKIARMCDSFALFHSDKPPVVKWSGGAGQDDVVHDEKWLADFKALGPRVKAEYEARMGKSEDSLPPAFTFQQMLDAIQDGAKKNAAEMEREEEEMDAIIRDRRARGEGYPTDGIFDIVEDFEEECVAALKQKMEKSNG